MQVQPFRSHAELASSPGRKWLQADPTAISIAESCSAIVRALAAIWLARVRFAVVDGLFAPRRSQAEANPFYLDALCDWLDLAGVVVIDVSQLKQGHVPERPEHVDAVILDSVDSAAEAARWETEIEVIWRTPVVGWMEHAPLAQWPRVCRPMLARRRSYAVHWGTHAQAVSTRNCCSRLRGDSGSLPVAIHYFTAERSRGARGGRNR